MLKWNNQFIGINYKLYYLLCKLILFLNLNNFIRKRPTFALTILSTSITIQSLSADMISVQLNHYSELQPV